MQHDIGINLNDLQSLAKQNPKYASLLGELAGIDQIIKNTINDTITEIADPNVYYVKTELLNRCYNLYLYNSERNATVGYAWLFSDFLSKCQNKMIQSDVDIITKRMINEFNKPKISESKINWIF